MIFEKLCELISEQFGVEADTITVDTTFEDDLGADSLDIVELSMALEEEFGVSEMGEELPAEQAGRLIGKRHWTTHAGPAEAGPLFMTWRKT